MHRLTFYPLGNADTNFIDLEKGRVMVLDYADVRNPNDKNDLRWDIKTDIAGKLKAKDRSDVDVFCITHIDNDHVCGAENFFYLEHAVKYQGGERYKIKELWVPAGAITEEGCDGSGRVWRQEARHRLYKGAGIRVFGRPDRLKAWLESVGLTVASRAHLITDAGRVIPGFSKDADGVEFFLHSPHAHRINAREVEDRNQDCVVMQGTFVSGGEETRVMFGGDAEWPTMEDIVSISKYHGNEDRLEFDVFKLPHHCSAYVLSKDKGKTKTEPTELIKEWFDMAAEKAILISSSERIGTTDQSQPPHFQAKAYYLEVRDRVKGKFEVTMEYPNIGQPKPLVITINRFGPTVEGMASTAAIAAVTQSPPRAGSNE